MRNALIPVCCLVLAACSAPAKKETDASSPMPPATPQVQTGRYTSAMVGATTAQVDPLSAIIRTEIPLGTYSVGDAMVYLLRATGYRLASPVAADPAVGTLYHMPLPQVQRSLGPITVRDALSVLAGPAFAVVIDPVNRLVSFDVKEPYASGRRR